jgi:hypothetical protein
VHTLTVEGETAELIADLWRTGSVPHETTFVAAYACAYAELTGVAEVPVTRNDGHRTGGVVDDPRVGWFSGWDLLHIRAGSGLSRPAELLAGTKRALVAARMRASGTDRSAEYVPFFSRYPDLGGRHPRAEFLFRREFGGESLPPGATAEEPLPTEEGEPESILGSELYVTQSDATFTCVLLFRSGRYPAELVETFVATFRRHIEELPRRWAAG